MCRKLDNTHHGGQCLFYGLDDNLQTVDKTIFYRPGQTEDVFIFCEWDGWTRLLIVVMLSGYFIWPA